MKQLLRIAFAALVSLAWVPATQAALFTSNFGTKNDALSNCDDCATDDRVLFGGGQTINFFGTTYNGLFVSSNGYLTFDAPHTVFATEPIDTQTIGPMIAGLFTDLDSSDDPDSNIYINTSTPGEIIVTYEMILHSGDNTFRSTFQTLVRSDQRAIPAGQGQLGFFYGEITDPNIVNAGFGDGLSTVDPREVSFASNVPGTTLSNHAPLYFTLEGGGTTEPPPSRVPEPASLMLLGAGLAGLVAARSRRRRS